MKINLYEIMKVEYINNYSPEKDNWNEVCLNSMLEACKQALELAAENVRIDIKESNYVGECYNYSVNKQSITNTINQIK